jgi:TRAP-type C4-dicarboxylate transport system substrate-binding protein
MRAASFATTMSWKVAACLLATGGLSVGAGAQERLRVADALPVGHYISEAATKLFMQEVTRRTNGTVQFDYFPAEQLGKAKDMLPLTRDGVVDIGYVATSYVSDKLPLSSVAELPGSFSSSCAGSLAYTKIATEDGIVARQDWAPNGVRVLFALSLTPYQLMTSKRRYDGGQSAAGLKLRIPGGGALDATVTRIGATPIRIPSPELREALSRGTIDGLLFPFGSAVTYDLAPFLKYSTTGENFGSAVIAYVISEARWKRLSPTVRQAITEAADVATRRGCATMDKDTEVAADKLRKAGVEMVGLGADQKAELQAITAKVAREWADDLDKRGKPGSQTLRAFQAALEPVR